jgi:hypothetical protein
MFKTQEEQLELIFPRKGPSDTRPQGMDGGIEEPLPPSLRGFAMARVRFDVGDHAGGANARAIVRGIEAGIKIQLGASEGETNLVGHFLQGLQTFRQQDHGRLIGRSDWPGR